ncbi:MAG: FG-GAP repeat domain-containing protein [Solirubrobacteraceae bacterium]
MRRAGLSALLAVLVWAPTATALTFQHANGSPVLLTSGAPGGQGNAGLVVGAFNGDSKLDLAASWAGSGPDGVGSYVSVLLGSGAGGFSPATGSPILITSGGGAAAGALAVGKFNADQKLDLAVVSAAGSANVPGDVSILLGNGDGTFTPTGSPIAVGRDPSAIAVADLNGDQSPDLAVTNLGSGSVSILLSNGTGGFTNAPSSPLGNAGDCPQAVTTGDFNGDHRLDLAVGSHGCSEYGGYGEYGGSSGDLYILLGNGSGGFSPTSGSPLDVGNQVMSLASGDFNGDGKADLALAPGAGSNAPVLLGAGNGGFGATNGASTSPSSPDGLAIGDLNGDGKPDLAIAGDTQNPHYPTNGVVQVLPGTGNGTFAPVPDSPFTVGERPNASPRQVVVGDFNGDDRKDVAVLTIGCQCQGSDVTAQWGPSVSVLLGEPGNTSAPTAALHASPNPALTSSSVTLDASSSYGGSVNDPIVDYQWDVGDGGFTLDTGGSPQAFKTFSTVGVVEVRVKVTNATGATDMATVKVDVRQAPPPGAAGVSIDRGAYATNNPDVRLHVVWPAFSTQQFVSNDAALDTAGNTQTMPVTPSVSWTLPVTSSSRQPQIVYVRFSDGSNANQVFSDGIVLDTTVPAVQRATSVARRGAADVGRAGARKKTFHVRIHATEHVSGISAVQFSTGHSTRSKTATIIVANRKHRGIRKLARILRVRMTKAPVRVRVRSAAGTWSKWHRIG